MRSATESWLWTKECSIALHRIVHLEESFNNHWVQLPDHFRVNQKWKHINEGIVQMPVEHWQAWGINQLSKKSVPEFSHPHGKEMFQAAQSDPPLAVLCHSHMSCHGQQEHSPVPLCFPSSGCCREQWGHLSASVSPNCTAQWPQPLLTGHAFSPATSFGVLCWALSRMLTRIA